MLKRQDADSNWFHLPDPCRPGNFPPKPPHVWETVRIWIEVCKFKMESERKNIEKLIQACSSLCMIPHPYDSFISELLAHITHNNLIFFSRKVPLEALTKGISRQLSIWPPLPTSGMNHVTINFQQFPVVFCLQFQARHKPVMIPALRKSPDSVAPHNSRCWSWGLSTHPP